MDTVRAFKMAQESMDKEEMVFDWDKAARIIREKKPRFAYAGLRDDWEYTGGTIYKEGKPAREYTFLASTWAVPELKLDNGEIFECYVMRSKTAWGAFTKWPKSALKILEGK